MTQPKSLDLVRRGLCVHYKGGRYLVLHAKAIVMRDAPKAFPIYKNLYAEDDCRPLLGFAMNPEDSGAQAYIAKHHVQETDPIMLYDPAGRLDPEAFYVVYISLDYGTQWVRLGDDFFGSVEVPFTLAGSVATTIVPRFRMVENFQR